MRALRTLHGYTRLDKKLNMLVDKYSLGDYYAQEEMAGPYI
jgi:hypothetical protein